MSIHTAAASLSLVPRPGALLLLAFCLTAFFPGVNPPRPARATAPALFPELRWTAISPGLALGLATLPESRESGSDAVLVILRIDPGLRRFSLHVASEAGKERSFPQWSRDRSLLAGINASMYLPDGRTAIGYMRDKTTLHNGNMGSRLGAFFVAGRSKGGRGAPADIVERGGENWMKRLDGYNMVVQNFRLMDSRGTPLWKEGGPLASIAAIAKDTKGRILFILSQEALTAEVFTRRLSQAALSLSSVLYVEGGAEAGLFIRLTGKTAQHLPPAFPGATVHSEQNGATYLWKGRKRLLHTPGDPDVPVPNIIGVE